MRKSCRLTFVTYLLLALSASLLAQSTAPPVPDRWWEKNSFTAPDSLDRLLFRGEGNLSYGSMTGNYESQMLTSSANIILRQGLLTSTLNVRYDNERQKTNDGTEMSRTNFQMSGHVDRALFPFLLVEAGLLWEKNESRLLRNLYVPYAGIETQVTLFSDHQFNLFVAGARAIPTYVIPFSYFGMKDGDYWAVYVAQTYSFPIRPGLTLNERAVHLRNLDETKRYSTDIALSLSFVLSQNLAIMLEYSNIQSTEASFLGAKRIDTRQTAGIKVSL